MHFHDRAALLASDKLAEKRRWVHPIGDSGGVWFQKPDGISVTAAPRAD